MSGLLVSNRRTRLIFRVWNSLAFMFPVPRALFFVRPASFPDTVNGPGSRDFVSTSCLVVLVDTCPNRYSCSVITYFSDRIYWIRLDKPHSAYLLQPRRMRACNCAHRSNCVELKVKDTEPYGAFTADFSALPFPDGTFPLSSGQRKLHSTHSQSCTIHSILSNTIFVRQDLQDATG